MKKKMKNPNYRQSMRQTLIKDVFCNISYESSLTLSSNDGKDCIVQTIDKLIET